MVTMNRAAQETYYAMLTAVARRRRTGHTIADRAPIHVPGSGVAADEIVDPPAGRERATDPLRAWPDHLRIMADVLPASGAAVIGKDARHEPALFRCPATHHRFRAERAMA